MAILDPDNGKVARKADVVLLIQTPDFLSKVSNQNLDKTDMGFANESMQDVSRSMSQVDIDGDARESSKER